MAIDKHTIIVEYTNTMGSGSKISIEFCAIYTQCNQFD